MPVAVGVALMGNVFRQVGMVSVDMTLQTDNDGHAQNAGGNGFLLNGAARRMVG